MWFYVTYQLAEIPQLLPCVQAIRTHLNDGALQLAVVGPSLPADVADALSPLGVEWIDQDTVFLGLPFASMPIVPRGGEDMGPEIFQRFLAWTLMLRRQDPKDIHYAVAHTSFRPTAGVPLVANNFPVMPLVNRGPDPRNIAHAQGLYGHFEPLGSFSDDYMVFDARIVEKMLTGTQTLNPNRRFDEATLDRINLDDPVFSEFEIYGWFASTFYGQHVLVRKPDGTLLQRQATQPQPTRTSTGAMIVSFGKKS